MNADEMMYELGFEKVDEYSDEDNLMYQHSTDNDHWEVQFFYSFEIVNYSVTHLHWFKTVEEWRIMDSVVDMELHKAIHQVLLEHGWL